MGLISGQVIPKTLKLVLAALLLGAELVSPVSVRNWVETHVICLGLVQCVSLR